MKSPTRSVIIRLPRSLFNAGDLPLTSKLAKLDAGETEGTKVTTGTPRDRATILNTHGRGVSRELLESIPITSSLKSRTLDSVLFDEFLLFYKPRKLGFFSHEVE